MCCHLSSFWWPYSHIVLQLSDSPFSSLIYSLQPLSPVHISPPLIFWLCPSFTDVSSSSPALPSHPPSLSPLCLLLCHSLSIIHGAVTVGSKGPRNITTATTQQKHPHWIMGNWVTSQEREGVGCTAEGGCCHTHMHAHTPDRCPTKQEDGKKRGDDRQRQERQNQAGQWSRYCRQHRKHTWACTV